MSELRQSSLCRRLLPYSGNARVRRLCYSLAWRLEGGSFYSRTIRDLLRTHHGVEVGAYSYGECIILGSFPAGVRVGRYVSVAHGVKIFLRNHPLDRLSMHPLFYNPALGLVQENNVPSGELTIEHDAWIGERAMLTPGCHRIGLGAVVGAGAVVSRDVPDFAVVAGNPAKLIRYRFDEPTQGVIRESRWWERSVEQLKSVLPDMIKPLDATHHPLLRQQLEMAVG